MKDYNCLKSLIIFFKPKPIEVNYTSDRVKHFLGSAEVKFEDIPFYMCLNNKKCYELLI